MGSAEDSPARHGSVMFIKLDLVCVCVCVPPFAKRNDFRLTPQGVSVAGAGCGLSDKRTALLCHIFRIFDELPSDKLLDQSFLSVACAAFDLSLWASDGILRRKFIYLENCAALLSNQAPMVKLMKYVVQVAGMQVAGLIRNFLSRVSLVGVQHCYTCDCVLNVDSCRNAKKEDWTCIGPPLVCATLAWQPLIRRR